MIPSPAPLGDDWSLWARAVFANIDIYRDQRPGWPYKGVKWAYLKKKWSGDNCGSCYSGLAGRYHEEMLQKSPEILNFVKFFYF